MNKKTGAGKGRLRTYKVVLCVTGSQAKTYVKAHSEQEAALAGLLRVSSQSSFGWDICGVTEGCPPKGFEDIWNKTENKTKRKGKRTCSHSRSS